MNNPSVLKTCSTSPLPPQIGVVREVRGEGSATNLDNVLSHGAVVDVQWRRPGQLHGPRGEGHHQRLARGARNIWKYFTPFSFGKSFDRFICRELRFCKPSYFVKVQINTFILLGRNFKDNQVHFICTKPLYQGNSSQPGDAFEFSTTPYLYLYFQLQN